jgi:anti-sigma factor RsiW
MTLEEKILAYLDGSLDEETSAELLHSLSTSPEKRAVLEEHLRLRNMFSLGQKPFAIPASTERALAERIPALAGRSEVASRFVRRSALSALFAGASEWFAGVFAPPVARWGLGFASLAAIGVTAWLMSTNGADTQVQIDRASNSIAPSNQVSSQHSVARIPSDASFASVGSRSTVGTRHDRVFADRNARLQSVAPTPVENTSVASNDQADGSINGSISTAIARSEEAPQSIARSSSIVLPKIASVRTNSTAPGVSVSFGYAQYQYQLPGVGTTASASQAHPELAVSYDLSSRFAVKLEGGMASHPSFEMTARNERVTSISGESYSRVTYETAVETKESPFTRLGVDFTLNPEANYEIHLGTSGGVQFATSLIPMATVSAGVTHPLTSMLSLDLSGLIAGTWGQSVTPGMRMLTPDISSGPVGFVHEDATLPSTAFACGFGVKAGLRYEF